MSIPAKRLLVSLSSSMITGLVWTSSALASDIGGVPSIPGASSTDLRVVFTTILQYVLNFLGLFMVIAIIVAGFRLVLSQGEEEAKEKAKKGVFYAIIGLVLVLLAKAIVLFVTTAVN